MTLETWKPVVGWEGVYAVSDGGRVKRILGAPGTSAGRILKSSQHPEGYRYVGLYLNGRRKQERIHRLVAEAFIHPIPNGMQINHKNGVKDDNRPENLEIVTPADNTRHSFYVLGRNMAKGEANGRAKLASDDVVAIRCLYGRGFSQGRLARIFEVDRAQIRRILKNEQWRA